jgi:hypothetical protein
MMINFTPTTIINYYALLNLITAITLIMFARMKKKSRPWNVFLTHLSIRKIQNSVKLFKNKNCPHFVKLTLKIHHI